MRFDPIKMAAMLIALCASAPAQAADNIAVSYDVSLGGSRIMKASYAVDIVGNSYTSALDAKTTGLTKWLKKIKLNLSARGSVDEAGVVPQRYEYARKKNDKLKTRNLVFHQSGELVTQGTDYDAAILKALGTTVMDPLSMLLKVSRTDNPCRGKHRAFDGRDVFDVTLTGGNRKGDRLTCVLVYKPVAGGDVEEGDIEPKTYEITLLRIRGSKSHVPIQITGTMKGVDFDVSARSISVNGAALTY